MTKTITMLALGASVGLTAMVCPTTTGAQEVQVGATFVGEVNHDISAPLSDIAIAAESSVSSGTHEVLPVRRRSGAAPAVASETDPVIQRSGGPLVAATVGLNFDGVSNISGFVPPDTNASVGSTQVVETTNVSYQIFNKSSGASILGPAAVSSIWSGFAGTLCGKTTSNYSDPVVLYDKAASRWLVTILAYNSSFTSNSECVAVSTGSDATLTYNRYEVSFGSSLPDYPKFGVWSDAYYASFNIFSGGVTFLGAKVCALDRASMLAGGPSNTECFQRTTSDFSFLPSDVDGATPPATNEPDFFVELGSSPNTLELFDFHSDFATPANATFTGPTMISIAPYTQACASTGTCIPQPGISQKLDSLGDRLMHRLAWRNLGGTEHLVVNHAVKPSKAVAAVRWYDIINPDSAPAIAQQGTFTVGAISLWMGSLAMDKAGDIALGFSASSSSVHPSILYTGRIPTDPINTMEAIAAIKLGSASQTINRWGDYTSMAVDPIDDCTFWYANEYLATKGSDWHTRLATLKFPGCS
ncbi:MAG TPA: hypothetical protein VKS22_16680 [Candidatus Binataceae bacterium]|nr:hypothetical protein [Candidatus Binataceae bacterium]